MSFRDVPNKRRLLILVPDDIYQHVLDVERANEGTSLSEIGSTALAKAMGLKPSWEGAPNLTPSRRRASATA